MENINKKPKIPDFKRSKRTIWMLALLILIGLIPAIIVSSDSSEWLFPDYDSLNFLGLGNTISVSLIMEDENIIITENPGTVIETWILCGGGTEQEMLDLQNEFSLLGNAFELTSSNANVASIGITETVVEGPQHHPDANNPENLWYVKIYCEITIQNKGETVISLTTPNAHANYNDGGTPKSFKLIVSDKVTNLNIITNNNITNTSLHDNWQYIDVTCTPNGVNTNSFYITVEGKQGFITNDGGNYTPIFFKIDGVADHNGATVIKQSHNSGIHSISESGYVAICPDFTKGKPQVWHIKTPGDDVICLAINFVPYIPAATTNPLPTTGNNYYYAPPVYVSTTEVQKTTEPKKEKGDDELPDSGIKVNGEIFYAKIEDYYSSGNIEIQGNSSKNPNGTYEPVEYTIPSDIFRNANRATKQAAKPFEFILKTPFGSYVLPGNIIHIIPDYAETVLDAELPASAVSIKTTLSEIHPAQNGADDPYIIDNKISSIVKFKVEMIDENGDTIREITEFLGLIKRILPVSANEKPEYYGVYTRKTGDDQWSFVPAQWTDTGVEVYSNTNSQYVVSKYTAKFSDVRHDEWYFESITLAASKKLVQGVGNNLYHPDHNVTRAEFVQMIVNILKFSPLKPHTQSYEDVNPEDWFYESVLKAKSAGLLSALIVNGEFNPNLTLTREEMAYILAKAAGYAKVPIPDINLVLSDRFKDIYTINPKYISSVSTTVKLRLMQGTSETTFEGKNYVTRAQTATVLLNLCRAFGYVD